MTTDFIALLPEQFIVYLVRHATPDFSRTDIPYHVVPGPELTDHGLQEAEQLGLFFQQVGIRQVFASPLERTWRTALIAAAAVGLTPECVEDLHEWGPQESEASVHERMQRAFLMGAQISAAEGPVALVTHGGPVHALLKLLGLSHASIERFRIYDSRNPIPPAGAWRVEQVDGERTVRLVFAPQGVKIPAEVSS